MNRVGSQLGSEQIYSMRELNQRTAEVIREINESGVPAAITRHGRFVALITPLTNADVESTVLSAIIDAAENPSQLRGKTSPESLKSPEELAEELDVHLE